MKKEKKYQVFRIGTHAGEQANRQTGEQAPPAGAWVCWSCCFVLGIITRAMIGLCPAEGDAMVRGVSFRLIRLAAR